MKYQVANKNKLEGDIYQCGTMLKTAYKYKNIIFEKKYSLKMTKRYTPKYYK